MDEVDSRKKSAAIYFSALNIVAVIYTWSIVRAANGLDLWIAAGIPPPEN